MTESTIQAAVRAEAPHYNVFLWRNNNGVLQDARGVPVRFGLGNDSPRINKVLKSSDLIGIHHGTGRFVAIECKPVGWLGVRTEHERAQLAYIDLVNRAGGVAAFVTTLDEFRGTMHKAGIGRMI